MLKRIAIVGATALLIVVGVGAAGRWHDGQIATCKQRSTRLAALELLNRRPDGFRPLDSASGCDDERAVAYASAQFSTRAGPDVDRLVDRAAVDIDEQAVTGFYRQLLEGADWRIFTRKAKPGPDAAALCASKELAFGTVYVDLSFPVAGMYEVSVSDYTPDSGANCV
ncbi:hypothetical protein [Krasilnikovia sp. MM14-A1004]|uniref:hypothetical protein n=1 Tax=Krasilnikovia sp. MM14-A1004 TaxID=3373541 RepID=UPI00399CAA8F